MANNLGKNGVNRLIELVISGMKSNQSSEKYKPKTINIGSALCSSIKNGTLGVDVMPTSTGCILSMSGLIEAEDFTTITITDDMINSNNFKVGVNNKLIDVMSEGENFVCCKYATFTLTTTGFKISLANIVGNTQSDGQLTDLHLIGTIILFNK